MSTTTVPDAYAPATSTRWVQLALGLVCMMAISSPQYTWALFTGKLPSALATDAATVQWTFTILIVLQTFFSPFQGWLVEKFGPRLLIAAGCALTGLSWVLASSVTSVWGLYATYGLFGGLGTGIVYVGVVGLMVAWFPDRRGFAVGVVAAGYGMGAILTTFPITNSIDAAGYQPTFLKFGLIFGLIGVIAALGLKSAPARLPVATPLPGTARDVNTPEMLRNPIFWLMFVMMSLMSTTGLMVIAQIGAFANDYGVAKLLVFGLAALPLALSVDRFFNGLTRPFFGWISDRIGRENTMFIAFALEGCALALWIATITHPVAFVLLSGIVFFGWGEIFSLFPSTLTDTFGARFATKNYGCLYIAQGVGSIAGAPLASYLHAATGSWTPIFGIMIGCDFLTAILAIALLKPMRRRYLAA